jgi:hypothetical protein
MLVWGKCSTKQLQVAMGADQAEHNHLAVGAIDISTAF